MASTDRRALLALYRSPAKRHGRKKQLGHAGADLSRWSGVQVDEEGRVALLAGVYDGHRQGIADT